MRDPVFEAIERDEDRTFYITMAWIVIPHLIAIAIVLAGAAL